MPRSVFRRVYRARPLHSVIMCLPALLLVGWYAWSAFAQIDRYRRAVHESSPLTLETLQIALFDQLESDIRRMLMSPPPDPSSLYTYHLRIKGDDWDKLVDSAELDRGRPYVDGKLELDGRLLDAEIRLRGNRHWHLGGAQKSLKVKLDKGELIQGHRIFNLLNDPTPMVVGQQLIADLARESGLLTPVSSFVRVKLNARDIGVYHYETAADESLLRSSRRMPGSIYASSLPGSASAAELWWKTELWSKVSSRTDSPEEQADTSDLAHFLWAVRDASFAEFDDFVNHEMDLTAFARLDAIDVAFGGDQRDFRENHDYYFDPYRGRWEPIAGGVRGFRDDPELNIVDNPVLLRLKMTPGYMTLRDRVLYELLMNEASPPAVQARATRLLKALAPELRTDPYWDAYRELPRIDTFHRRMVRPNTLSRLSLVVESELETYADRHARLVATLQENPLYSRVGAPEASPNGELRTPLELVIDGHAGVALSELSVDFPSDCVSTGARLERGGAAVPAEAGNGQLELTPPLELYPTVGLVPQRAPSPRRGNVRGELVPTAYPLTLVSSCAPRGVTARGRQLATDSRVVSRPLPAAIAARLPARRLPADAAPKLVVGEVAPHPWELPHPAAEAVVLGPGEVRVEATRVFGAHQSVRVAAGTQLLLGPKASLIFLGKVEFDGTRLDPIRVESLGPLPWGGIAIQGPATRGSRLSNVLVSGGTKPVWRSVPYPSMVNIHHTSEIQVRGCRFSQNGADSDAVHIAYVDGLELSDTTFVKVPGDALDLELTTAQIRRMRVIDAGDEALDAMGSHVTLSDSIVIGARGNGISAGEESVLNVQNTLIAGCTVGALAKNAADIALSGSVLYANETGLRTYQRTVRYAGESDITADVLFVAASKKRPVKRDDRDDDRLERGRVLLDLPQPGVLEHMREDVLELSSWQALDSWIDGQREEAVR